jgi:drug/metabolite transporter (DMT)-like permease
LSEAPGKLAAALAIVYVVWGSTYLAIRWGIDTLPPFAMASLRFLVAGAIVYAWARWRGAARPSKRNWAWCSAIGALLLLCGNGGVVWAEQWVPSGVAALLVAVVPLWMVLLDWLESRRRPSALLFGGVLLGLIGVGILAGGPGQGLSGKAAVGAGLLLASSVAWSVGSMLSRRAALPQSKLLAVGMQMLSGGALLALLAALAGDWLRFDFALVSARSWMSLAYLVVAGSIVGFTAYTYLLRNATPAVATTYAYVNPVVAVFLGWALAGEPVGVRTVVAAAVIVTGVAVVAWAKR